MTRRGPWLLAALVFSLAWLLAPVAVSADCPQPSCSSSFYCNAQSVLCEDTDCASYSPFQSCSYGICSTHCQQSHSTTENCSGTCTSCTPATNACEGLDVYSEKTCFVGGSSQTQKTKVKTCAFAENCTPLTSACDSQQNVKTTFQCTEPGCTNGACSSYTITRDQVTQGCSAGTSCTPYTFYCKNNQVWKKRDCTTNGCNAGACYTQSLPQDSLQFNCLQGCSNGACTDPDQAPTAAFSANPQQGIAPLVVHVDASNSSDPDASDSISNYGWDWGDGSNGSGVQADHVYQSLGQFTIQLTVNDRMGKASTAAQTIQTTAENNMPGIVGLQPLVLSSPPNAVRMQVDCVPSGTAKEVQLKFYDDAGKEVQGTAVKANCNSSVQTPSFEQAGVYRVEGQLIVPQGGCVACQRTAFFALALPYSPQGVPETSPAAILAILAGLWLGLEQAQKRGKTGFSGQKSEK